MGMGMGMGMRVIPVEELGGVPDGAVGDTAPLWLKVEHVVPEGDSQRTRKRSRKDFSPRGLSEIQVYLFT